MDTNPYAPPDAPIVESESNPTPNSAKSYLLHAFMCFGLAVFGYVFEFLHWVGMTRAGREPHPWDDDFVFWSNISIFVLSFGLGAIGCWLGWRSIRVSGWWSVLVIVPNALWVAFLIWVISLYITSQEIP